VEGKDSYAGVGKFGRWDSLRTHRRQGEAKGRGKKDELC